MRTAFAFIHKAHPEILDKWCFEPEIVNAIVRAELKDVQVNPSAAKRARVDDE